MGNTAKQVTDKLVNASYEHTKTKNKISKVVFFVLSIIAGIIGLIVLFFNWKTGLIIMGVGVLFYGFSRLAKFSNKMNKKFHKRYNEKYAEKPQENKGNI